MTDTEIMEALQCCIENNCTQDCPFYYDSCIKCRYSSSEIISLAFGLINRQKAEIERVQTELDFKCDSCENIRLSREEYRKAILQAKSEAVREFAKELKNCFCISKEYLDIMNIIDNLVKETAGAE